MAAHNGLTLRFRPCDPCRKKLATHCGRILREHVLARRDAGEQAEEE
eukprot:gene16542-65862_t